jgi:hypothetical protein
MICDVFFNQIRGLIYDLFYYQKELKYRCIITIDYTLHEKKPAVIA